MANYTNTFGGAAKDIAGDVILGAGFDTQFGALATMSATKADKVAGATVDNVATTDANGNLKDGGATIAAIQSAVKAAIFPVGSIYLATVATNPSTLLGFGTWTATGVGRVLVGVGTSDAAYALDDSDGQSDAIIPAHTHTATQAAHTHTFPVNNTSGGDGTADEGDGPAQKNTPTSSATPAITVATATGGESVTGKNMPPYLVVHMWERTA